MKTFTISLLLAAAANVLAQSEPATFNIETKLLARDSVTNGSFGTAIAISGDTIAVGGYGLSDGGVQSRPVHIFIGDGSTWKLQQLVTSPHMQPRAQFASAVALDRDTLVVLAPFDAEDFEHSGAAYVFIRQDGAWQLQQRLTVAETSFVNNLGFALALSGDTCLIAHKFYRDGADNFTGAVHVFQRNAGRWTYSQKLRPNDGVFGDVFGNSLALDGDRLVVGAPLKDDIRRGLDLGAAYVFERSGTLWTERQKLTAADGAPLQNFGRAVGMSGNTIVVSALPNLTRTGFVYPFARSADSWVQDGPKLQRTDNASNEFGGALVVEGDILVVGDQLDSDFGPSAGAAFVYQHRGTNWILGQKLAASDAAANAYFGYRLAMNRHVLVVAAPGDVGTDSQQGAVYVYESHDTTPPVIRAISVSPQVLFPPNHKMVPVTVRVEARDASGPTACQIISITSNEPDRADWIITGPLTASLRAERSNGSTERLYTITVECTDTAGNKSQEIVTVSVPQHR